MASYSYTAIQSDGKEIKGSGGSNSGSGVTHTELWNYSVENAGTIKYGTTQDYTLRDNINNYDFILIENMSYSGDDTDTNWQATNHFIFSVEELNSNKYNNYINFTSYISIKKSISFIYCSRNHYIF